MKKGVLVVKKKKRRFRGEITMVRDLTPPDILNILLQGRIFKISDFAQSDY
jgi:hypothetical protein